MMSYSLFATLVILASTYAAEPESERKPHVSSLTTSSDPSGRTGGLIVTGPAKQIILPSGPPPQYPSELQYNVNLLEPQFQYPGFNYVPDKQPFPRVQPPVVFYAGGAPPGQQFLYRPGAPPGNFLVPQPQPQPGPGVIFGGGNPQGPVFVAGYPKPAHIPPIEKDAEEIPINLAGNHPPTRTGRPTRPIIPPSVSRPEKLETFDEPVSAGEADVLAEADKNPNNIFPKKSFPAGPPLLRPGQQFFILNGNPLFSNFPLQGVPPQPNYQPGVHQPNYQPGVYQPNYQPGVHQPNTNIFLHRQPQYVPELQPQQFHQVPIQDLFLRNAVTGQISDVKPISVVPDASFPLEQGNYISLNTADDFRNSFLLRNAPIELTQEIAQRISGVPKEYELSSPALLRAYPGSKPSTELRHAKDIHLTPDVATFDRGVLLPGISHFRNYYRYAPLKDAKIEDDSVIIDAKSQNDDTDSEAVNAATPPAAPSLSQAQPSAIALAGNGGVASARPKGTALAGVKGLAFTSPQATAIAGPSKEEPEKKVKSKKERL